MVLYSFGCDAVELLINVEHLQKANEIREKQKVILPPRRSLSASILYLYFSLILNC
jgi:hypothetical protein